MLLPEHRLDRQSNEEVEEAIAMGSQRLSHRHDATEADCNNSRWDMVLGVFFVNVVMYCIILVQGFSTPLLLLLMLMINNRAIMGEPVNSRVLLILGWVTTGGCSPPPSDSYSDAYN